MFDLWMIKRDLVSIDIHVLNLDSLAEGKVLSLCCGLLVRVCHNLERAAFAIKAFDLYGIEVFYYAAVAADDTC